MLDNREKSQLKLLLQTPQWSAFERLAALLCDKLRLDDPVRDTEWETIKATLSNHGQIRGIQYLLQQVWDNIKD
jgi:hypothetical protein